MCLWWIKVLYSVKKYETAWQYVITPFSLTPSSWSAADSLTAVSITRYRFVVFGWDTLLIIFPEGCALLILHSDFSIHTDTSHVLRCIPSQICGECHPLHLFYHLYFLTLILKPTNFSSSHSFMDRFRRNPCSFSCCYLPPQFLIPSPAQKTSLCWSRLVYAG